MYVYIYMGHEVSKQRRPPNEQLLVHCTAAMVKFDDLAAGLLKLRVYMEGHGTQQVGGKCYGL